MANLLQREVRMANLSFRYFLSVLVVSIFFMELETGSANTVDKFSPEGRWDVLISEAPDEFEEKPKNEDPTAPERLQLVIKGKGNLYSVEFIRPPWWLGPGTIHPKLDYRLKGNTLTAERVIDYTTYKISLAFDISKHLISGKFMEKSFPLSEKEEIIKGRRSHPDMLSIIELNRLFLKRKCDQRVSKVRRFLNNEIREFGEALKVCGQQKDGQSEVIETFRGLEQKLNIVKRKLVKSNIIINKLNTQVQNRGNKIKIQQGEISELKTKNKNIQVSRGNTSDRLKVTSARLLTIEEDLEIETKRGNKLAHQNQKLNQMVKDLRTILSASKNWETKFKKYRGNVKKSLIKIRENQKRCIQGIKSKKDKILGVSELGQLQKSCGN